MQLQVALDCMDAATALNIARKVAPSVDILEAGTPLIKIEGIGIVTKLKKQHPDKIVLADLKTMDTGKLEADIAFRAGADIVTVLGCADDATIAGAVASAKQHGKRVMVDLINVPDKQKRAKEVALIGAAIIGVHSGIDQQHQGKTPLQDLKDVLKATGLPISVAGGINLDTVRQIIEQKPSIIVVGGAITSAQNPGEEVKKVRGMFH